MRKLIDRCMLVLFAVMASPVVLLAQDAAAPEKGFLDKFSDIVDKIPTEGAIVVVLAGVMDLVLRLVKTDKPRSIMYFISDILKLAGKALDKVGAFMDRILGQRVK